ncbi:MAG: hypothetical protein L6Q84_34295 [Polyangiaceae bacterium]|nr:hypothetical protein [Polyangiaceae bacterium]
MGDKGCPRPEREASRAWANALRCPIAPRTFVSLFATLLLRSQWAAAAPTAKFPEPASAEPAKPPPQRPATAAKEPWGRAAARERVRRASEHSRRGDAAQAMAELNEALRFDPSFGDAYLELAKLRERAGDLGEAERVYEQAARLPSARAQALFGRARVSKARGQADEAFRALEASVELAPERQSLELLAEWYVQRRAWPAALVAWRRVLSTYDDEPGPERDKVRVRIQALVVLAADADPVVAGAAHSRGWVRRSLARMAKKPR